MSKRISIVFQEVNDNPNLVDVFLEGADEASKKENVEDLSNLERIALSTFGLVLGRLGYEPPTEFKEFRQKEVEV